MKKSKPELPLFDGLLTSRYIRYIHQLLHGTLESRKRDGNHQRLVALEDKLNLNGQSIEIAMEHNSIRKKRAKWPCASNGFM